jgi:hypothetical protein
MVCLPLSLYMYAVRYRASKRLQCSRSAIALLLLLLLLLLAGDNEATIQDKARSRGPFQETGFLVCGQQTNENFCSRASMESRRRESVATRLRQLHMDIAGQRGIAARR